MAIDIITSIILIVRAVPSLAKNLSKFSKWLDDVLARNGKGARKILSKIIYTENDVAEFVLKNGLKLSESEIKTILKLTSGRADLCESILLSTKEIIEGKSVLELLSIFNIKRVPKPGTLSNYQARIWYTWKKTSIEKEIEKISSLEKKAKKAFDLRNEYRTETRKYMKDQNLADYLEVVEKNVEWDDLLARTLKKEDVTSLDDAYRKIIFDSQKGRDSVDKLFKLK